jgi:hypothetical protein
VILVDHVFLVEPRGFEPLTSWFQISGAIRGLELAFSDNGCTFVVSGTSGAASDVVVVVSYSDTTGRLKVLRAGGNLHFYQVSKGCLGLVNSRTRSRSAPPTP